MADMLFRYQIADDYTLEELRRRYHIAGPKERIALLQELYSHYRPPYEIALLAVQDQCVEVREWIARHGKSLDYRKLKSVNDEQVYENPERDLRQNLKNDPDPFVRACLRENSHVFAGWFSTDEEFRRSNHMERLALMRNPEIRWDKSLLREIFDHQHQEFGISLTEREELICAFLTNKEAFEEMDKTRDLPRSEWPTFLVSLWELASQWPKEKRIPIPAAVYRYVPTSDETKAKCYQAEEEPLCRRVILESCSKRDPATLKLGVKDADETCRSIAESRVERFELQGQIESDSEKDREAVKPKSILERYQNWFDRNEQLLFALASLFFIGLGVYSLLFTVEGYRIFEKLLEFYSTLLGKVIFWFFVILFGLVGIGIFQSLYDRYRWFRHVFWLGLIGMFQFIIESRLMAGIFAAVYVGTLLLPKVWEDISNDLVNKIVAKLDPSKKVASAKQ